MDDPWDVKSVRKSGQYTSCMKINGVPLLPPVLSKECRTEMQYYKLLAKEVEKRISILQPYIESDTESLEDRTNAPEIVECEQEYDESREPIEADTNQEFVRTTDELKERVEEKHTLSPQHTEVYNFHTKHSIVTDSSAHPHLIVDFSLNINETIRAEIGSPEREPNTSPSLSEPVEIPERDYNCTTHKPIELIQDTETTDLNCDQKKETVIEEIVNFSFSLGREASLDSAIQESISQEGPPSLSSKSFTGSLNNIHLSNDSGLIKPLVRQHSYTILNPSPQLLAHLEVQSLNLGVDMSSISMSESLTNLSPGKKRRSWDLETAKAKWSNMALELKQTNLSRPNTRRSTTKQLPRTVSPSRAKCVAAARTKYSSLTLKHTVKNEAIPRARTSSPPRSTSPSRTRTSSPVKDVPSASTIILEEPMTFRMSKEPKIISVVKEPISPKNHKKGPFGEGPKIESPKREIAKSPINKNTPQKTSTPQPTKNSELVKSPGRTNSTNKSTPKHLPISEADDPATKVRELYEKIQKQQLLQMASLVEKQKREQMLLQQAFEDQNNLLFKQLKTICPKSPDKIKEAWVEKSDKANRGPVSLSQLIKHSSPLASTLTDSNKYISYCDDILKKSKDISSTLKTNGNQMNSKTTPKTNSTGNKTRPNSPLRKNTPTSRKLNYDTSASSERDYEIVLTDRTNDTLADLNVTFPSDTEEGCCSSRRAHSPLCAEVTVIHRTTPLMSTDSAIKCMEQTIQKSINSCSVRTRNVVNCQPTARQRAAATTLVAYAKGFLVRRLMKTARVQATVQTIKDALLCALQLHQDREGIRGADVDLHRRLIQQITAACYSLHDTFITSSASERCALLAADRARRAHAAARPPPPFKHRHSDVMSQSHSGAFPPRQKRHSASPSLMTQSNYETWRSEARRGRRPWR